MNTYIINIYCHRLGCEVEVYASSENEAINKHLGDCGNRKNPCDAEAIGINDEPLTCPECEHDLHDGATTCPTCTASDYLEDR